MEGMTGSCLARLVSLSRLSLSFSSFIQINGHVTVSETLVLHVCERVQCLQNLSMMESIQLSPWVREELSESCWCVPAGLLGSFCLNDCRISPLSSCPSCSMPRP